MFEGLILSLDSFSFHVPVNFPSEGAALDAGSCAKHNKEAASASAVTLTPRIDSRIGSRSECMGLLLNRDFNFETQILTV